VKKKGNMFGTFRGFGVARQENNKRKGKRARRGVSKWTKKRGEGRRSAGVGGEFEGGVVGSYYGKF